MVGVARKELGYLLMNILKRYIVIGTGLKKRKEDLSKSFLVMKKHFEDELHFFNQFIISDQIVAKHHLEEEDMLSSMKHNLHLLSTSVEEEVKILQLKFSGVFTIERFLEERGKVISQKTKEYLRLITEVNKFKTSFKKYKYLLDHDRINDSDPYILNAKLELDNINNQFIKEEMNVLERRFKGIHGFYNGSYIRTFPHEYKFEIKRLMKLDLDFFKSKNEFLKSEYKYTNKSLELYKIQSDHIGSFSNILHHQSSLRKSEFDYVDFFNIYWKDIVGAPLNNDPFKDFLKNRSLNDNTIQQYYYYTFLLDPAFTLEIEQLNKKFNDGFLEEDAFYKQLDNLFARHTIKISLMHSLTSALKHYVNLSSSLFLAIEGSPSVLKEKVNISQKKVNSCMQLLNNDIDYDGLDDLEKELVHLNFDLSNRSMALVSKKYGHVYHQLLKQIVSLLEQIKISFRL